MDLSVLIVTYNVKSVVKNCFEKLKNSRDKLKKEIILADNDSSDGTASMVRDEFPEVVLIESQKNLGFARANNLAYKQAKGKYILLLNPDAFVEEDTVQKTVGFMERNPKCGILGCQLTDKSARPQMLIRRFPTPWRLFLLYSGIVKKLPQIPLFKGFNSINQNHSFACEVDWVPGSYFLARKEMIDEIGFFDRDYFLYYEDVDLCLRAKRNGWKIFYYPDARAIHIGGEAARKIGKITPSGKQLEKLKLQSEFMYFRKNYGLSLVLMDFFFILVLDLSEVFKKIILRKKHIKISEKIKHSKKAYNILLRTAFGAAPIY